MGNSDLSGPGAFHDRADPRQPRSIRQLKQGIEQKIRSLSGHSGCVFLLADSWLGLLFVCSNIIRIDIIANRIDYRIDFQNRSVF